jgi:hypothetical protein
MSHTFKVHILIRFTFVLALFIIVFAPHAEAASVVEHSTLPNNLVSYWKLDESSGTRYDAKGTNNLTDTNTVLVASGTIKDAADFEKSNSEYLTISDASQTGLDITGDISISAWVNFESKTNYQFQAIAAKANHNGEDMSFIFGLGDSESPPGTWGLVFWPMNSAGTAVIARKDWNPSLNTWYHVAMKWTASSSVVEFFVNGSSIGTSTTTGVNNMKNSGGQFNIGSQGTTFYLMDGKIDELGVWSRTFTNSEVSDLYNSGSGLPYSPFGSHGTMINNLVSYWKLDESSGTRYDAKGTNNLTDTNTVLVASGTIKDAADFEKSNSEYLTISDASQTGLDITGDISISAWVNFESKTNYQFQAIAAKANHNGEDMSFIFGLGDSESPPGTWGLVFWPMNSAGTAVIARKDWNPSLNTWYHVAMKWTASSSVVEFFVNGSSIGTSTTTGVNNMKNSGGQFNIGSQGTTFYLMDGKIDELGVWSRTFTNSEVSDLYNSGSGLAY